jgi:hypothetical protein
MKLDIKALAVAIGVLWGGCILFVGLISTANGIHASGSYWAKDFLLATASVYPGYRGVPEVGDTLLGAGYALVDGLVAGALLAWLYNRLLPRNKAA